MAPRRVSPAPFAIFWGSAAAGSGEPGGVWLSLDAASSRGAIVSEATRAAAKKPRAKASSTLVEVDHDVLRTWLGASM